MRGIAEFEREVKVRSFLRRGKVVRAYRRTGREAAKKKPAPKRSAGIVGGVVGGAMVLGVPTAAFLVMKSRYTKGIPASARLARRMARSMPVDNLSEQVTNVTFTIGGITPKAKEGRLIAQALRRKLPGHHLIPYENKIFKVASEGVQGRFSPFKELLQTSFRLGRNPDSVEVAARAYAYHMKYPQKPINLVGHSAGGMIGKESANILERLGVPKNKIKVVTTGTPDLGFLPSRRGDLNIFAPDDPLRIMAHKDTKFSMRNKNRPDFGEHFVLSYFRPGRHSQKAHDIVGEITNYLGQ